MRRGYPTLAGEPLELVEERRQRHPHPVAEVGATFDRSAVPIRVKRRQVLAGERFLLARSGAAPDRARIGADIGGRFAPT